MSNFGRSLSASGAPVQSLPEGGAECRKKNEMMRAGIAQRTHVQRLIWGTRTPHTVFLALPWTPPDKKYSNQVERSSTFHPHVLAQTRELFHGTMRSQSLKLWRNVLWIITQVSMDEFFLLFTANRESDWIEVSTVKLGPPENDGKRKKKWKISTFESHIRHIAQLW